MRIILEATGADGADDGGGGGGGGPQTIVPIQVPNGSSTRAHVWKWENINEGDTVLPIVCGHYTEMMVQTIAGVKDGVGVGIEGSLDPTSSMYSVLVSRETGLPLDQGVGDINSVRRQSYWVRPTVGAGSVGMTILIKGRI